MSGTFENAEVFLRLRLACTQIRVYVTKTELSKNALQTGRIGRRCVCVLVLTENVLKTKLFENDDVEIIMWFPCFPQKNKYKMIGNCCVPKFVRRGVDGKQLTRFCFLRLRGFYGWYGLCVCMADNGWYSLYGWYSLCVCMADMVCVSVWLI